MVKLISLNHHHITHKCNLNNLNLLNVPNNAIAYIGSRDCRSIAISNVAPKCQNDVKR